MSVEKDENPSKIDAIEDFIFFFIAESMAASGILGNGYTASKIGYLLAGNAFAATIDRSPSWSPQDIALVLISAAFAVTMPILAYAAYFINPPNPSAQKSFNRSMLFAITILGVFFGIKPFWQFW